MYKSWFFYADDIVLIPNNESEQQLLLDEVYEVFVKYGSKIVLWTERLSKECGVWESLLENNILGVIAEGGVKGDFKSLGERVNDVRG